jgi:hypothetical protein
MTLNPAYLKWTKNQDNYTTYYAGDWENYTRMISYSNPQPNVYFGFYGCSWLYGHYFEAYFDNLVVRAYHDIDIIGTATDNLGPQLIGAPSILIFYYGLAINYSLMAFDPSGIDSWWVNDTYHFSINHNGLLTNNTYLPVGIYPLLVSINDTLGNIQTQSFTIYILNATTPPTTPGLPLIFDIPLETLLYYSVGGIVIIVIVIGISNISKKRVDM